MVTSTINTVAFKDTDLKITQIFKNNLPTWSPPPVAAKFPPPLFEKPMLSMSELAQLNIPIDETSYLSIGGGLGSFAWVNHLLVYGVDPTQVASIGFEPKPYGRYQRLCQNSQIPAQARLRSDSGAMPNNIWGWPGYALQEMASSIKKGQLAHAAYIAWQIFTEPVFAEPFTPRSMDVFDSIDGEMERIGWDKIWRFGRVRAIRKLEDGRYVVAYSQSKDGEHTHKFMVAQHLHLAIGYPRYRLLPTLQAYRTETNDFKRVVNAYENHNQVYEKLRMQGGTVLIRGRGIVASRLLQRLYEERVHNPAIKVLHLMRNPHPNGADYEGVERLTENHFELQYYNFPKACFGGDLRAILEKTPPAERDKLINTWGGTTTANRAHWRNIVDEGLREGWYNVRFGDLTKIESGLGQKITVKYKERGGTQADNELMVNYIIDATGLDAGLEKSPLMKDLLEMYNLEKNSLGRLDVSNSFEVPGMRNGTGRVHACGTITLGGSYGPVDSFVGLQFAAQRAVNHLAELGTAGLKPLSMFRSIRQWFRWARGVQP